MASIVALTGFEYGTTTAITNGNAGNKIFDVSSGTVSIVGAAARTGSYGLRVALNGANYVGWNTSTIGTSQTTLVATAYFKLSTDATGNTTLFNITTAADTNALEFIYRPSTDDISFWSNTSSTEQTSSGVTITSGNWYRVDMSINVSANPWTIQWKINGVAQTNFTPASAATSIAEFRLGTQTTFTGVCDYDDVAISVTGGDYPLGETKVQMLSVDPAGTVTLSGTTGNFNTFASNGTLTAWNATTARNAIDEIPPTIGASADGWCQIANSTTDYVEMPLTTYTLQSGESVAGGRMIAYGWATNANAATIGFRSYNGTTERTLFAAADPNFDNSTTTGCVAKMLTLADIDTQSELDALAIRAGFSGDAAPDIGIHAVYVELGVFVSSATNAPAENVAITATAETPTVKVSPPSESVAITATANDAAPLVKPNAEGVGIAATANDIQGTNITAGIQSTAVTATAENPAPSVRVNAECATITVAAGDATVSTVGNTNAQAEAASVSVTAEQPTLSVTTPAESVGIAATAETPSVSVRVNAEVATVTVDSLNLSANVQSSAGLSQVTAVANDLTAKVSTTSELVTVLVEAVQPTIQTGSFVNANAEVATVSVTANDATGRENPGSESAGVSVTTNDAQTAVYVSAGCAEVTVLANSSDAQIGAMAELVAVTVETFDPVIISASSAFAECATVIVEADSPSVTNVVPDPDLIIYKKDNLALSRKHPDSLTIARSTNTSEIDTQSGTLIIQERTHIITPGG